MINSVKKIPVLRYGLIVGLISVLFLGVFYLYLHYNSAQKLKGNIGKLISARENSELIDSCLLNLYNADNNSRLYALTGDKKYMRQFSAQVQGLGLLMSKIKPLDSEMPALDSGRLKKLINEKTTKTNSYIRLRILTDSLITSTLKKDSMLAFARVKIPIPVIKTVQTTVHIDTLKPVVAKAETVKRKKFFGRLFSSIAGKNKKEEQSPVPAAAPVAAKADTQTKTTVLTSTVYTPVSQKTRSYYKSLYNANSRLKRNEHDILLINSNLVIDILSELKQYKTVELAYATESKNELAGKVTDVFQEYNYLTAISFIALIALLGVVLYNIWKIFKNQRRLVAYSEKAEQYANNKSIFMANMSHEIRTPLNSVIGFSEQLSMSQLTQDQTMQINAIMSSSHMLLDVVNEILDFSKYETGKMNFEQQPFMLQSALNDVFNTVGIQAAKKGLDLKKSFSFEEETCFSGDVLRLKQVIMNLMVNAIKFTPTGEIFLQAMVLPTGNNTATLKVRIKDTGIGIKKQNLPLIFDEFSQVNDAQKVTRHKGTGLGLAICKKIVELQGGTIRVISEPGKGSVFSFELPFELANPSDCVTEPVVSESELAQRVRGAHVLLAEDNQLNVLLAKTILNRWHISSDIAYDGQEAIQLFEANKYDLVLTDIQMPIMGGLELLALIRQNPSILKADTTVIALTANVLKEDRDIYRNAGINDIVLKPFNERNLIEKISQGLKHKYANTDSMLFKYNDD